MGQAGDFLAGRGGIRQSAGLPWLIFPLLSRCRTHFGPGREKFEQTNEIVSGDAEDEHGAHFGEAPHFHLREPAPAEAFLDALAQPLADRIAQTCCDVVRDGGFARPARFCAIDEPVKEATKR